MKEGGTLTEASDPSRLDVGSMLLTSTSSALVA
jgi:hypothetical protein